MNTCLPLASSPIPLMRPQQRGRGAKASCSPGGSREKALAAIADVCASQQGRTVVKPPAELLKPQVWRLKHCKAAFMPLNIFYAIVNQFPLQSPNTGMRLDENASLFWLVFSWVLEFGLFFSFEHCSLLSDFARQLRINHLAYHKCQSITLFCN